VTEVGSHRSVEDSPFEVRPIGSPRQGSPEKPGELAARGGHDVLRQKSPDRRQVRRQLVQGLLATPREEGRPEPWRGANSSRSSPRLRQRPDDARASRLGMSAVLLEDQRQVLSDGL
jgi:hypothetical protein